MVVLLFGFCLFLVGTQHHEQDVSTVFQKNNSWEWRGTAENVAGFNNNMVMIAHFIENFPRILNWEPRAS